ncbi:hypothetical protein CLV35_3902 [Motilibacter peucedani]|uniref:Intracellular septation protein A n=1 Tax=Motilibacter peucedani TaxID=598650 RepID=A0A420XKF4_9ACTN|nr:VC0807 family protein [Motilibacter peucedani]RKS67995.1 hypothetical protein CLV35_3902 [Motilibacter peucedani]
MTAPQHHRSPAEGHVVVELAALRPTLVRAGRLLLETVLVPTLLLAVLIHVVGVVPALGAALGWCYLALLVRWVVTRHVPGTLLLSTSMLTGRAGIAMATSSALLYLVQPAVGSGVLALLFLGSAALGRPITMRLARDFVALPPHVLERRATRRMFTQVALVWGVSRLLDATMSVGFLRSSLDLALIGRGLFSPLLTLLTVGLCSVLGWRALARDGIRLRFSAA